MILYLTIARQNRTCNSQSFNFCHFSPLRLNFKFKRASSLIFHSIVIVLTQSGSEISVFHTQFYLEHVCILVSVLLYVCTIQSHTQFYLKTCLYPCFGLSGRLHNSISYTILSKNMFVSLFRS